MLHQQKAKSRHLFSVVLLTLLISIPSYATWSIIAVDRVTGEIGIIGASCTFDVQGIASIVPKKGAIVVQAGSSYFARMKGVELMMSDSSAEAILSGMRDKEFNPERQQYGVVLLNDSNAPLTYSGQLIKDWNGSKVGDDFAVLGNILVDEMVIKNAFEAFNNDREESFAMRLMSALKAGEMAGGDKRCGLQYARSAFISVYNPKDDAILKLSVHGIEKGGKPAVSLLDQQFKNWNIQQSKNDLIQTQNTIRSFNGNHISSSKIDAFIKHQMDSLNMPGLSIAFINDDKIVYHDALGVKNNETQEKVDDSTIFDAASMSKTVFSFFAMKMVDDGLIDLDTPLYTYMKYPDIAYDERYKSITARMVLSHTSGFPNWRFLDQNGNYNPNNKLTIQFEPGTKFQYSGEGYEYLAKVIAHLKGLKKNELQTLIKKEIFDPLNMGKSSFVWNEYIEKHRVDGHFKGKLNNGYSNDAEDPNFKASASLQTESKAYSNFLMAIMNLEILSQKSRNELLKIQSTSLATKKSKERKYGLGIVIEESAYGTNYSHGGDNLSNTALYIFNPEMKVGYVFFTNSEHKNTFHLNLLDFLLTQ
ncbi:serine hydrolase [Dokdonia sp.]|uniref:serine hydrolase n=1 Tax=Dokdonia sp. TaxID=2024995 RepID=UPI0032645129